MTRLTCRKGRSLDSVWLDRNCFSEAAYHEERVVDSQAQPQHRGQILNQNGQVPTQRQESCNRQSGRDGKLANGYWNQGRHQASESHQQKYEGGWNHKGFGVVYVVGAGLPNVEIKWRLPCQFELHRRIAAPQLVLQRARQLVKLRDERLHGTVGRGESHQNKGSSSLAQENRIAKIKMGNHSGHAGFLPQSLFNDC